ETPNSGSAIASGSAEKSARSRSSSAAKMSAAPEPDGESGCPLMLSDYTGGIRPAMSMYSGRAQPEQSARVGTFRWLQRRADTGGPLRLHGRSPSALGHEELEHVG